MPQLNWNDWKRDAIIALYGRFCRKNFRFYQTKGILNSSGDISALANEGYVKKVFRDAGGTVWTLTDNAINRALKRGRRSGRRAGL